MKKVLLAVIVVVAFAVGATPAVAVPVPGEIVPVAIYQNTLNAFGMAYDSANTLIWWTQGDAGDALVHSLRPFNTYTAAELAGFTQVGGVYRITSAQGQQDVAGTTAPADSAYFDSLAYDSASGQLVMQGSAANLVSFDPFTGANFNPNYSPGSAEFGFSDGLDVDGGNVWYSGDIQDIELNGAVFAPTGIVLPTWNGLGSATTLGYSGVEQVGGSVFAVAVQSFGDSGRSRTIVRFDATTGELLGYDEDGDPGAARWEDMAFDGRYLYAADLRGNIDNAGVIGDIYVFDVTGGLEPGVPEPSTMLLIGTGLIGLVGFRRKFKK
jgi:hypothetical protein